MRVRKAVIPAAGLGTRFLPATKSQPKEMLPLVDTPAIQFVVEEAVRSGLDDILIVTSHMKRSIEDHFDRSGELEDALLDAGKQELYEQIRHISELADIHYIRQKEPLGLGHAITVAANHVGREPFVAMLGDDVLLPSSNLTVDMLDDFEKFGRTVVGVQEVPKEEVANFGCIKPEHTTGSLMRVLDVVEKPDPDTAPSNLAVIGRYVFTPEIFDALESIDVPPGDEVQLTEAISKLAGFQTVYAHVYEGQRFNIGDKLEYLRATVEVAAAREDLGPAFRAFLREFCARNGIIA